MDPFIGEIRLFAGNYAPYGWAFCNGQQLYVQQYSALYAVIGNTYGGNQTVFNLPNLRGRAALHQGNGEDLSYRRIGENNGIPVVPLTAANLPAHNHAPNCQSTANASTPDGNIWANTLGRTGVPVYNDTPNVAMNSEAVLPAGGKDPHNNMQPYLGLSFIIAVEGIFPVRS